MKTLSRLIIALGLGLVGLGKRIDKPAPASRAVIKLSRRHYRIRNRAPSAWEVTRLGLSILLSSAAYGLGVTYG